MKLLRFGEPNNEKPGLVDEDGNIRDLTRVVGDIEGVHLAPTSLDRLANLDVSTLPIVAGPVRYAPCVAKVGKFICIGLNYADHAAETGAEIPEEPVILLKATSAVNGPNDDIIKPKNSKKLDWEVELAVIIGQEARYIAEENAHEYIAGYCICNDVSEREFQMERGGTWDKGKGCDTFGPIGPWLVTQDELKSTDNLSMWLDVNGQRFQDSSTSNMIFKPAFLVSYVSQFMSLQAGDVISTGTPAGVGLGQKPPVYLNVGDIVNLGIEGLGEQKQQVVAYA